LAAGEAVLRPDVAAIDDQFAVVDFPGTGRAILAGQLGGALSVEQHHGVRRRGTGFVAGRYRIRPGPVQVVDFPRTARKNRRRVRVAERKGFAVFFVSPHERGAEDEENESQFFHGGEWVKMRESFWGSRQDE
jgi:hypothetical protein